MTFRSEQIILLKKVGILLMRKPKTYLTEDQKENIDLLVLKGYTLQSIADLYGCSYALVIKHFKIMKSNKIKVQKITLTGKNQAYYNNENDYGKLPKYSYEDLSKQEKDIYNKLL